MSTTTIENFIWGFSCAIRWPVVGDATHAYAFAKKRFDRVRQALNSTTGVPALRLTNALSVLVPLDPRDLPEDAYMLYEELASTLGQETLPADCLQNGLGAAINTMNHTCLQRAIALLEETADNLDKHCALLAP